MKKMRTWVLSARPSIEVTVTSATLTGDAGADGGGAAAVATGGDDAAMRLTARMTLMERRQRHATAWIRAQAVATDRVVVAVAEMTKKIKMIGVHAKSPSADWVADPLVGVRFELDVAQFPVLVVTLSRMQFSIGLYVQLSKPFSR